jgi:hypothetical protein
MYNTDQMNDDLLKVLNSHTIVTEDGQAIYSTFEPYGRDSRDFASISRWTLKKLMAEAWMKGFDHGR